MGQNDPLIQLKESSKSVSFVLCPDSQVRALEGNLECIQKGQFN